MQANSEIKPQAIGKGEEPPAANENDFVEGDDEVSKKAAVVEYRVAKVVWAMMCCCQNVELLGSGSKPKKGRGNMARQASGAPVWPVRFQAMRELGGYELYPTNSHGFHPPWSLVTKHLQ